MAKEIEKVLKVQVRGGAANPAPPVGPALGQRGINIMEFCKAFNEKTKSFMGKPVPVVITVYKDLIKKNAKIFLDDLGNPYDIILMDQDGTISIEWGAYGVPETFIIDSELNILRKYI